MVNKVPGRRTNEGSQVTGCRDGGRGGEDAREGKKETQTRRDEETEGNKERGGMSEEKKYTSEETGRK